MGLSREQIFNLSFDPSKGHKVSEQARNQLYNAVRSAEKLRAGDPRDPGSAGQRQAGLALDEANQALAVVRTIGDAVVASYFAGDSDKARRRAWKEPRRS